MPPKEAHVQVKNRLVQSRHAHRRAVVRERLARLTCDTPSERDEGTAGQDAGAADRPITPGKPDSNEQASMWPDPWAGHRG
jgi:hypothetical protein